MLYLYDWKSVFDEMDKFVKQWRKAAENPSTSSEDIFEYSLKICSFGWWMFISLVINETNTSQSTVPPLSNNDISSTGATIQNNDLPESHSNENTLHDEGL